MLCCVRLGCVALGWVALPCVVLRCVLFCYVNCGMAHTVQVLQFLFVFCLGLDTSKQLTVIC